jgi:hypothetical protein
MNTDIELMIKIYDTKDVDWMGDEIRDIKKITKHHIVKKADDGVSYISNYALLTVRSHQLVHYIEEHYPKEYDQITALFMDLNMSLKPPTAEYYEKIRRILRVVKKDMKNKRRKRSKGSGMIHGR